MKSLLVKNKLSDARLNAVILSATIGISAVLLVAAYGKWFYPAQLLKGWDRGISIFELVFIGFLFYGRKSVLTWLLAAFIFASWGGYAGFWYQVHLPCSCMGEMLHLPTGLSLVLDGLFFAIASTIIYFLAEASELKRKLYWGAVLGVVGLASGFFIAKGIYQYFVLTNG